MAWTRKDWLLLLGIVLVAAVLRFYQLGALPPGFQFDEAFNAIDAQQVLQGNRPLFLPANAGREVLYTYWQALLVSLFGFNVYTLRLASAILGLLTIPVSYVLVRMLIRQDSRAVAAGTALAIAISLWHFHFSRYGIRVITMPIIFSLVFGLAYLAAHASAPRLRVAAYAASGFFLGLGVWTHPTGRLAPFILIAFTAWLLWRYPAWRTWRPDRPLGGLFLSGLVAFLVFLPLGIEFYRHPEFFYGHASEVSIFAERVSGDTPLRALLHNIWLVAGMFSFTGDPEWTHGPAGRSVFDWPMALVYYLGLGLAVARMARHADNRERDALLLLVVWAAVMLFPSILSEAAPNYSRTLPSIPALFVPAGLGLAWLWRRREPAVWAGPLVAASVVLFSTGMAVYDYFVRFAHSQEVYYLFDGDKLDALAYLAPLTAENEVYLSQLWGDHHATVWLLRNNLGIKSFDAGGTLVLPPPGRGAVYAFPREQDDRAEDLAELWPNVTPQIVRDPYGAVLLYTVTLSAAQAAEWPADLAPTLTRTATFVEAPTLLGLRAATPARHLTLYWRADAPLSRNLTVSVHLLDRDGARVAQIDELPGNGSYVTLHWKPGERVIERYYPTVLDPCAGGEPLNVQVAWYELRDDMPRRPRADAAGTTALAGEVTLPYDSYPRPDLQPAVHTETTLLPTLTLTGYTLRGDTFQPGDWISVDLVFHSLHAANAQPPAGLEIALLLLHGTNETTLWQGPLASGAVWESDESLCRRVRARLPASSPPGDARLALSWTLPSGSQRVHLGTLTLQPSTRRFTAPPLQQQTAASWLDDDGILRAESSAPSARIRLLGLVSLAQTPDPASAETMLDLELAWQAEGEISGSYQVFVHLLDAQGTIIAQSDAIPGRGYRTNRWLPGEVVLDHHTLPLPAGLPPGDYTLVTGLYELISMARLTAYDATNTPLPNQQVTVDTLRLPLE